MTLGLSTYAFVWRRHPDNPSPISLEDMLDSAVELGCGVFQVCDYWLLEEADPDFLIRLAAAAAERGLELELGTRGVEEEHLSRFLEMARAVGARLVRSMLSSPRGTPSIEAAIESLRAIMPAYETARVTLGLETYEQFSTDEVLQVIDAVGSPALGVCLDPGNSVARLEFPEEVVAKTAPHVVNLHVKDFAFARKEGMIGFTFAGAPLGEGQLDYDGMVDAVDAHQRQVNQVVEHWLTRQGTLEDTCLAEEVWVRDSVAYLKLRGRLVDRAQYEIEEDHRG